jgi:SAM-dependent methyltransferase
VTDLPEHQDLPEHVAENRRFWDGMAGDWIEGGEIAWAGDPAWGTWQLPEADVGMLPDDMTGVRAIELGCGTGYVSAWMARRGATVVGIDNSPAQLETARRLADEHGIELDLRLGNAEVVDEPDGSFDFAISEYGAAIWCDPFAWIPEAARLLRPGGRLHFLGNHPLAMCCVPHDGSSTDFTLHRDYFGLRRLDWREVENDPGGIEFNLPISEWLQVFARCGFALDEYLELQAPADVGENGYGTSGEWARRYPSEQVWKLTRR